MLCCRGLLNARARLRAPAVALTCKCLSLVPLLLPLPLSRAAAASAPGSVPVPAPVCAPMRVCACACAIILFVRTLAFPFLSFVRRRPRSARPPAAAACTPHPPLHSLSLSRCPALARREVFSSAEELLSALCARARRLLLPRNSSRCCRPSSPPRFNANTHRTFTTRLVSRCGDMCPS
jgi:hypothetical protein